MFSIIIPLYNKADYIEKAIKSVLAQTFQEFELIVVNDGSTDDSFAQLAVISQQLSVSSYQSTVISQQSADEKLKYSGKIKIIDQENRGVSTARNNGVKLAKYDYIAFLDADDWWEPTYLERMKLLIDEFPMAGLYGSSFYLVKNGHNRIAPIGVKSDFKSGLINYFQVYANTLCQPIWTGATIIRKSVFMLENGFNPQLKLGEDFDLWVRIAVKSPVAFLNVPLAYYNQDVDLSNRAIGEKLYEPEQHMLFSNYGELRDNQEFRILFERLAVYGLLPYYLTGKNVQQVKRILKDINWENHSFKYRLYYRIMPKVVVRAWLNLIKMGSKIKKRIKF